MVNAPQESSNPAAQPAQQATITAPAAQEIKRRVPRRIRARLRQFARETKVVWSDAWRILRRNIPLAALGAAVLVALCVWVLSPHDLPWLGLVQQNYADPAWRSAAEFLSYWGDFLGFNLALLIGLYGLSRLRRSRYIRLMTIACLLGACLSGGTANLGRALVGRARPHRNGIVPGTDVTPGFYGPNLKSRLHSCPSAHTATAFGATVPLVIATPSAGLPLTIIAAGVAWSRMFNNKHHPTDVIIAVGVAALWGVPLGLAVRRRRRRGNPRSPSHEALDSQTLPSQP